MNPDNSLTAVCKEYIEESGNDQRIDNFLFKRLKNIPKSHVYQLLRSGQIRVNGKRVTAKYRLQLGDLLRIPPIINTTSKEARSQTTINPQKKYSFSILHEDDVLLVINKPSGMAVHGGSGISFGVIEQIRAQNPTWKFLELVHRLDRETSGVLLIAKKRNALVELHRQIREGLMEKHYSVMVKGEWRNAKQHVKLALNKYVTASGERRVAISSVGQSDSKQAHTIFSLRKTWKSFSLLDAEIKTGRTHQIRVHLAHLGYPILGDDKYGDFEINKQLSKATSPYQLTRMFLHARTLKIIHPASGIAMTLEAPLPEDLQKFTESLDKPETLAEKASKRTPDAIIRTQG
ncbi:MAG: RluA family pseudouridine synthase [Nitrosomonas sp.]|nr:RluA family pseudouridine synthase [Nitrosomonas sp.]